VSDDTARRLAEALLKADEQDRRLDGYRLDVVHRYAAALLPVVRELGDLRAAEELDTAAMHRATPLDLRARAAALRGEAGR
jgi:hypothetical protein